MSVATTTKEKTETKFRAIKTNKCWSVLKKVGLCTFEEYMEKENIDHGVESDGNVVEKDKMLHEKISELIDEICSSERNKKCEIIERLLSHVHKLTDENKILRIHLGIHKDTTDHTITIHKNATDHTITRQNKPQFSRSKSMGPSFLGRFTGCTGT
ncbi:hypothetical protein DVH24_003966 [Malus domestica]|uniref:Uncharacterized protein n=1 Tax=Malus domestica TaxID=3750 RepID=A0A498KAD4_MALDO|nr:hypothetical protein DVH24_003966 [Malus domestica]